MSEKSCGQKKEEKKKNNKWHCVGMPTQSPQNKQGAVAILKRWSLENFQNGNAFPLKTLYMCVNIEIEPSISEKLCVMITLINSSHFKMAAILKNSNVECTPLSDALLMCEI